MNPMNLMIVKIVKNQVNQKRPKNPSPRVVKINQILKKARTPAPKVTNPMKVTLKRMIQMRMIPMIVRANTERIKFPSVFNTDHRIRDNFELD